MSTSTETILTACGREIGGEEIAHVQEVVGLCTGLSRTELARTLCEHWGWLGATGKYPVRACTKLLEKLDRQGAIELPEKRGLGRRRQASGRAVGLSERSAAQRPIECGLSEVHPVVLEPADDGPVKELFNEFVERYHPLGFKPPFGCSLRYFVVSPRGRLGCVLVASAARALRCRDDWIGWSARERLSHLPWVVNNTRFLLFPWVGVPSLASHVLGQLVRRVADHWEARWGYRPVLMETFVDPRQHRGVCYRAAGWCVIGKTTGRGLRLSGHEYRSTPKLVLVRPLTRDFRARLCSTRNPK